MKRVITLLISCFLLVGMVSTLSSCRRKKRVFSQDDLFSVQPTETSTPIALAPATDSAKTTTPTATFTPTSTVSSEIDPNMTVDDIVQFGVYEQDKNTSNGQEAIDWIVLERKKDGKVLLISKDLLDCPQHSIYYGATTWETCALRKWLNTKFHDAAFSSEQQTLIASVTLTNPDNPTYGTDGGNNTTDKVFLLSIDEALQYFTSDEARKATATEYAKKQGGLGASSWWLRSPGDISGSTAYIYASGKISYNGRTIDGFRRAVRPALWINLEV